MQMTLTKQQLDIVRILNELGKPAKINELQGLYKERYKSEIGIGIHKQIQRLVEEGYLKNVGHGCYDITDMTKAVMENKTEAVLPNLQFDATEVKEFTAFSVKENAIQLLAENLNPGIIGLENERLAVLASLVSLADSAGDRNRVSVLIEGEVSSGKTSVIKWCYQNLWGFWADSDAREAALKGTGRGYQLAPGLLSMANNSVLYIDELDKMPPSEQNALLSAIEDGFVPINKDGVNTTLKTGVRIIATSNNRNRIIQPLLSRFDLKLYTKCISDEDIQRMIRKKGNEWGRDKEFVNEGFLKRYLQYAKSFKTELPEDRTVFNEYIIRERETGSLQGQDIRAVESVYRITLAIARLRLKEKADIEDLKQALELRR